MCKYSKKLILHSNSSSVFPSTTTTSNHMSALLTLILSSSEEVWPCWSAPFAASLTSIMPLISIQKKEYKGAWILCCCFVLFSKLQNSGILMNEEQSTFSPTSSSLWSRQLILWDTHFPFAALNVTPFWLGENLSVFLQIHYEIPSAITELADHLQRHVVISSSLLGKWKQRKRTITMAPQSRKSLPSTLPIGWRNP